ncbi:2-hydroxy-3-oxopropionate reductase [Pelagovum pacificum]|uniref:2-hydroxy-3-oxopropionate reductase n=1 Tax=Pelagovum pacificum TaxID=2588711 RepID=A0A5C5G8F8_9RHOB|nr:2-hydroxy-3-oxopropionate reductase [Pelagovum pacificum]QQA41750.1 2-hydroxy-3-oxopropionate reductase [Pelagovum pacificum]TNY31024.1 2-hydroxy-3-oxopropionate reductase [Pelagovum pacificum]
MKIGFIGLGVMGRPMAGHLIDAGHDLSLHRVKDVSRPLVEKGGTEAASAKEAASGADVVILMVPDTPDVEEVLFGEGGAAEGLGQGTLVIDMSSISPVATKEFAARIEGAGGLWLDAPVSGGQAGAENAALTIMCGGSEEAFGKAKPLLELMGKRITHVGDAGAGQTAKVCNQVIVGLTIQAVAEALTLAEAAGADPAMVREALLGGFADSTILKVHGERMLNETFDPGFRINLHRKDMTLAVDSAKALDLALPNTATVQQMMNAAIGRGDGDLDHSALIRTLKGLSGR